MLGTNFHLLSIQARREYELNRKREARLDRRLLTTGYRCAGFVNSPSLRAKFYKVADCIDPEVATQRPAALQDASPWPATMVRCPSREKTACLLFEFVKAVDRYHEYVRDDNPRDLPQRIEQIGQMLDDWQDVQVLGDDMGFYLFDPVAQKAAVDRGLPKKNTPRPKLENRHDDDSETREVDHAEGL